MVRDGLTSSTVVVSVAVGSGMLARSSPAASVGLADTSTVLTTSPATVVEYTNTAVAAGANGTVPDTMVMSAWVIPSVGSDSDTLSRWVSPVLVTVKQYTSGSPGSATTSPPGHDTPASVPT